MKSFTLFLFLFCVTSTIFAQTIEYPNSDLVPASLLEKWRSAGQFSTRISLESKCIDIHNVTSHDIIEAEITENTYLIDVDQLNTFINSLGNSSDPRRFLFFKEGYYLIPKNKTINLSKTRIYLVGEGSEKTYFNIVSTSDWMQFNVDPNTAIKMSADDTGISCLSIICNAFVQHPDYNIFPAFNPTSFYNFNKGTIEMRNIERSYIRNIKITNGYGASVLISKCDNVNIFGSYFNDNMIHGGSSGMLGYGIMMRATENSLIQNNCFNQNRHGVVIEGNGDDNNNNASEISSFNVVAHNYFGEMDCDYPCGTPFHPWGVTIHGHGLNHSNLIESNVIVDRLAIDDEHGSNGTHNMLYRNFVGHKIEIEKINGCTGNRSQLIIANDVDRTSDSRAYNVKAEDHISFNNRRRQSSSSNFIFAATLGRCNWNNNFNLILPTAILGNSAYLNSVPSWLSNHFNTIGSGSSGTNLIPALMNLATNNFPAQNDCSCGAMLTELNDDHEERARGEQAILSREESDINADTDVLVYPSPMSYQSNIEVKLKKDAEVQVEFFDLQGRLIRVILPKQSIGAGAHKFTIERGDLVAGLYILKVAVDDVIITKKLIVQ